MVIIVEVKTAELKAKLSRYLRLVREEGNTYVVLDRKTPVALLTPINRDAGRLSVAEQILHARPSLEARGIRVRGPVAVSGRADCPDPMPAPDGRTERSAIETVRGSRDY